MKLTILGSGTFVPELKRSCPSYIIEYKKENILFDIGRGSIRNLLKLKKDLHEINRIFISHMHTDHSTELASFIQLILDTPEKKKLKEKYIIYGPKGIKRDIQNMLKTFHIEKHKHLDRIKVKEIFNNIVISGLKIKVFPVKHAKINSLAYRLEFRKKVVCYSGDSSDCEGLRNACKNVDLAIMEATGPKEWRLGHINGEDLGKLAQKTKIKKLVVIHIANTYLPRIKKDIKKNYKGKLIIAKDLMEIQI